MRKDRLVQVAVLSMAIIFVTTGMSNAQQYHGPQDYRGTVKIPIPFPANYPPVNSGMPIDVLQGYIVFDSLMHMPIEQYKIDSITQGMGDSDTLRYAMRYLYEMIDYDPIAFYQLLENFPRSGEYLNRPPRALLEDVLDLAARAIPDSGRLIAGLTATDAIVDLEVTDTFSVVDSTKPTGMNRNKKATCTILDVIKGKNLPLCNNMIQSRGKGAQLQSDSGACFAFSYWPYWESSISYQGVRHLNAPDWISPGTEYIAFLRFVGLGPDSAQNYITISPGCPVCSTMGLYALQSDGTVYDPNNDFGFGSGLSLAGFKAKLREKIASIVSYHN